ncbi:uncharacterized protein LOC131348232 isoform X3 [Hemibagrus wyckioides]|nr:uncharacterized protein LOC131348232 isoform X3 [Hemibagrus wyckioides]
MAHDHRGDQMQTQPLLKYFTLALGSPFGLCEGIEQKFQELIPGLQNVQKPEDCDFIMAFCPDVVIETAEKMINILTGNKPAVLVVLHHTLNPEDIVPDSSRSVKRQNTITVDCRFKEGQGLLRCSQNDEALTKVLNWIEDILERPPRKSPTLDQDHQTNQMLMHPHLNYVTLITGNTLEYHVGIERRLQEEIPHLNKVQNLKESDFILVFCPVVSRAGTDIEAAVKNLSTHAGNKPAVLVVLHHTFNPELIVPDSSRCVKRQNTITVDCLFREGQGLLPCLKNHEALSKITNWLNPKIEENPEKIGPTDKLTHDHRGDQMQKQPLLKYFNLALGSPFGLCEGIEQKFQELIPGLQNVQKPEDCDFIMAFCPDVVIETAEKMINILTGNKPAVLVVLHHTLNPEDIVPDSSRSVKRQNTIIVDCLFNEDQGLLRCCKNNEALSKVTNWLHSEALPKICKGIMSNIEENPEKIDPIEKLNYKHTVAQKMKHPPLTYFTLKTGKTLGYDVDIERKLQEGTGLQKVMNLEESDFILVFCPVVSRAGTDIEAAVRKLTTQAGNKPAVLVVLHHTFDPEDIVPDSSRSVKRRNTITVDCLFREGQGLLPCLKNHEALSKITNWLNPKIEENPEKIGPTDKLTHDHRGDQMQKQPLLKYFNLALGSPFGLCEGIEQKFQELIPGLQNVQKPEDCDFIMAFCPDVVIETAEKMINILTGNKPAVLVVLHHTLNPEDIVPDSSRSVKRQNTIIVDCLFNEDQGLLRCCKNNEALSKVTNWLHSEALPKICKGIMSNIEENPEKIDPIEKLNYKHTVAQKMKHPPLTYFTLKTGKTLGYDVDIERKLQEGTGLQKVMNLEESDFILVFCPVVSRAGTDIEAAVRKLTTQAGNKPAVLVVLHHTFDPEDIVSDSSRSVKRRNTITVDCLFREGQGLLPCLKNHEALSKITNWLNPKIEENPEKIGPTDKLNYKHTVAQKMKHPPLTYFTLKTGKTLGYDVDIERKLQEGTGLQKVMNLEESDFILVFCPVVSRAGTDIEAAVRKLTTQAGNKPAVLVVLHHTFDPEDIVSDSSRSVKRRNTITVDCLFHEGQGLLTCSKNHEALSKVTNWIEEISGRIPRKRPNQDHPAKQIMKDPHLKYFTLVTGKTLGHHVDIQMELHKVILHLQKVVNLEESDFILVFCPVVSQAGTDIEAAVKKLSTQAGNKPAVLVVLHHTFNPELIVPDSSRSVKRQNTIIVDCLFHEDQGLLRCSKNNEALSKVTNWLHPEALPMISKGIMSNKGSGKAARLVQRQ